MITYNFLDVVDQTITFVAASDIVDFTAAGVAAKDVALREVEVSDTITNLQVTANGQTVTLFNTTLANFTTSNTRFADGSVIITGDRLSTNTDDDNANTLDFDTDVALIARFNSQNYIHGLGGDDTIDGSALTQSNLIFGGLGSDSITTGVGAVTVVGGNDFADTADGADTIVLNNADAVVFANAGADTISIGAVLSGDKAVQLFGGSGGDSFAAANTAGALNIDLGADADSAAITSASGSVTIAGGSGADTIDLSGSTGNALILGGGGVSDSSDGADSFITGTGSYELFGNGGGDSAVVNTSAGNSAFVHLGRDGDSITSATGDGALTVLGGLGSDDLDIASHTGTELIFGGNGTADTSDGADTIVGGAFSQSSTIFGNGGADVITVTPSNGASIQVFGGAGADTINAVVLGNASITKLFGNLEADTFALNFTSASTQIELADFGNGDDIMQVTLSSGSAQDIVVQRTDTQTTLINDQFERIVLSGYTGNIDATNLMLSDGTVLATNAGGGAASIAGSAGDDQLIAGDNGDTLTADAGNDILIGGAGEDIFSLLTANFTLGDTITGGAGVDVLSLATPGTSIVDGFFNNVREVETVLLDAGDFSTNGISLGGQASIAGITTLDASATSGLTADISGMSQGATLIGGSGDDTIGGSIHDDALQGGSGDDQITGSAGRDTFTGGDGSDLYIYNSNVPTDEIGDTFTDIDFGTGVSAVDQLQFSDDAANYNLGNNDDVLDGAIISSITSAGAAGTELVILRNVSIATESIEESLNIINADAIAGTGVINLFHDSTKGHVVAYYDTNGQTSGGHTLLADMTGLAELTDMDVIDFGDFSFI